MINELYRPAQHSSFEEVDTSLRQYVINLYVSTLSYQKDLLSILNMGCGGNLWLENDLRRHFPKATIISADINHSTAHSAIQNGHQPIVVTTDAHSPPFINNSFDALILNGSVGEIAPDKSSIIGSLSRLSNLIIPGGKLFIHTVSAAHTHLYQKYQTGTDWIFAGLNELGVFNTINTLLTSEKYKLEMVIAEKNL